MAVGTSHRRRSEEQYVGWRPDRALFLQISTGSSASACVQQDVYLSYGVNR